MPAPPGANVIEGPTRTPSSRMRRSSRRTHGAVDGTRLEIWLMSQTPQRGREMVESCDLRDEDIAHPYPEGGRRLRRRLCNDDAVEAAWIAKAVGGGPVKPLWTREDDMRHDFYRPGGGQSPQGRGGRQRRSHVVAWSLRELRRRIIGQCFAHVFFAVREHPGAEFRRSLVPHFAIQASRIPLGLATGALRALSSNAVARAYESFIDELARCGGQRSARAPAGSARYASPASPRRLTASVPIG